MPKSKKPVLVEVEYTCTIRGMDTVEIPGEEYEELVKDDHKLAMYLADHLDTYGADDLQDVEVDGWDVVEDDE